ncbi:MAG: class I SAM-dependent methyltransferase [Phycisphaerae bacterium]|nr:class I SAM-dependent methyltransferase [Phycisphaerae bacterium]
MHQTPHRMKHSARHEFERWAHTYDRSILQRLVFQPSYRAFLTELVRWRSDDPRPFDMLDVGCGTGTWPAMVAATELPVGRLVGLDYAYAMCRLAHEKAAAIDDAAIQFVNGDSEHLPFADASFDLVTCSNSFHHYPHQGAVVREFRRLLRPGGRLMIIDGFRDNLIGWIAFDVLVARAEGDVHHAPWSLMRRYALEAGFGRVEQRKFGVLIPLFITVAHVAEL